ncbi:hypothetical protein C8R45DRAFT_616977 [Mycena sanguinolenta]|nr:hypothetical protein C8R45DRAFT_616977 [Mycena sanguinolenta]
MTSSSCHAFVQKRIITAIKDEAYRVQLLTPSEQAWDSILDDSDRSIKENRRMEWLGDGIIAGCISSKLCEMFPKAAVEFYHVARDCLVSNITFTYLTRKIGADLAIACPPNKTSADVFEILVGTHSKNGLKHKLDAWLDDIFIPLIKEAEAAYFIYKAIRKSSRTKTPRLKSRTAQQKVLRALRNAAYKKQRNDKLPPVNNSLDLHHSSSRKHCVVSAMHAQTLWLYQIHAQCTLEAAVWT